MKLGAPAIRSLIALACFGIVASVGEAAPPREHARGVLGQDELRRSIRQLENDWDRLLEAWLANESSLKGEDDAKDAAFDLILEIEDELDELRDGYASSVMEERLSQARSAAERCWSLQLLLEPLELPKPVARAWEQLGFDLRRLASEGESRESGLSSRQARSVAPGEGLGAAVADIEDLSDELKRYLLRTDSAEAASERRVTKMGGPKRPRTHDSRLERAVLEFEEAADELKMRYRKLGDPTGNGPLLDRLARSARTIDFTLADGSGLEEARREWREIVPALRIVLRSEKRHGIGTGWERHP